MQRYDPDSPGGGRWPPPDIEGMLRDLGERFRGLDGRRIAAGAGVVLLVILLWSSWFTVQPEETGVVQRFGAVVRTVGPGLHFKLPFGIERAALVPTARVLKEEFGFRSDPTRPGQRTQYADNKAYKDESLMLTGDLNVIDVQWIVQYRIEDPVRYLFRVRESRQTNPGIARGGLRQPAGRGGPGR